MAIPFAHCGADALALILLPILILTALSYVQQTPVGHWMRMARQVYGAVWPGTLRWFRMWSLPHEFTVAFQVVWKKAVIVARTLSCVGEECLWSMGFGNCFENELYFSRDVPEAKRLPLGLRALATPVAKTPAKGAAKPHAKPSGKVAAKSAAKPGASEPILIAPIEDVQLFKVKCDRQKNWHMEPIPQQTRLVLTWQRGLSWSFCACIVHVLLCAVCPL